jgi:hypothetical protein
MSYELSRLTQVREIHPNSFVFFFYLFLKLMFFQFHLLALLFYLFSIKISTNFENDLSYLEFFYLSFFVKFIFFKKRIWFELN